jgi:hypothetical protein
VNLFTLLVKLWKNHSLVKNGGKNVPQEFTFICQRRKQLRINGVDPSTVDGHGRLFPYKDTGPHFVGPVTLNGQVFAAKIWENVASNGRKYLRMVIEDPVGYTSEEENKNES